MLNQQRYDKYCAIGGNNRA